jgi:hypothetical protein
MYLSLPFAVAVRWAAPEKLILATSLPDQAR